MSTGEIVIFNLLPTCFEIAVGLKQCVHNKFLVLMKGDKNVLCMAQKRPRRMAAWRKASTRTAARLTGLGDFLRFRRLRLYNLHSFFQLFNSYIYILAIQK